MAEKKSVTQDIEIVYKNTTGEISPILELDKEYLKTFYKREMTDFDFNETAYIKVMPSVNEADYELIIPADCSFQSQNTKLITEIEESITFANSSKESLTYLPVGYVTRKWVGGDSVGVTANIDEKDISVVKENTSHKMKGALLCTYNTYYDRLKCAWTSSVPTKATTRTVLVDFTNGDEESTDVVSLDISFIKRTGRDVRLVIKDIVTNKGVIGATVSLTPRGGEATTAIEKTADDKGEVLFEDLIIDATYDIVITAEGYITSDVDYLANDSFVVPKLKDEEDTTTTAGEFENG